MLIYRSNGITESVCRSNSEAVQCKFVRQVAKANNIDLSGSPSGSLDDLLNEFYEQSEAMGIEIEEV